MVLLGSLGRLLCSGLGDDDVVTGGSSSLHLLSERDKRRLRESVKRIHLRYHPREFITDYEADRVIEVLLPETVEALIRTGASVGVD